MFRSTLRQLQTPKPGARPTLEPLEDRSVPSAISFHGTTYPTIQAAINAAAAKPGADTITIPAGTYNESLLINDSFPLTLQASGGTVTIKPTSTAPAVTVGGANLGGAVIEIESKNVTISGLTVDASGTQDNAVIRVIKGGSATIKNDTVIGTATPADPASGNGIQIGTSLGGGSAGAAKVTGNTVSGYSGAGILVDGGSASAEVKNNTITGGGASAAGVTQYGVQVSRGATARVENNTITGNDAGTGGSGTQSAGIFFYQDGGRNSVAAKNTVSGNQDGILVQNSDGSRSGAIEIVNNDVHGNTGYAGIDIDHSDNIEVENNSVSGNTGFNGIALTGTHFVEVENNDVSGNSGDGIYDFQGNTNFITNNSSFNNGNNGIFVEQTTNDQLWNNCTSGNQFNGVKVLGGSSNDILVGDSSSNAQNGILLVNTTGNTIVGNGSRNNGGSGVDLQNAQNTLIAFNLITGNTTGAINTDGASLGTVQIANRTGNPPCGQGTHGASGDCSAYDNSHADADNDCAGLGD
jgi:parallel beta-helix repeat protein